MMLHNSSQDASGVVCAMKNVMSGCHSLSGLNGLNGPMAQMTRLGTDNVMDSLILEEAKYNEPCYV